MTPELELNLDRISYSSFKDYVHCPHYFYKKHILKELPFEDNLFTVFGNAIHEVAQKQQKKEIVANESHKEFLESFSKLIKQKLLTKLKIDELELVREMTEQSKNFLNDLPQSLIDQFGMYEVIGTELLFNEIFVEISDKLKIKGFIDLIIKDSNGHYHLVDYKTCSWGWDARKKNEKMVGYQLVLYKYIFCKLFNVDTKIVNTWFILLKRTAKHNFIEFVRVTSGDTRIKNCLTMVSEVINKILSQKFYKNRLNCKQCNIYNTRYCTM